jgi:hypothetical protein
VELLGRVLSGVAIRTSPWGGVEIMKDRLSSTEDLPRNPTDDPPKKTPRVSQVRGVGAVGCLMVRMSITLGHKQATSWHVQPITATSWSKASTCDHVCKIIHLQHAYELSVNLTLMPAFCSQPGSTDVCSRAYVLRSTTRSYHGCFAHRAITLKR